jgi:hydrogenase nickel incorporation protein HypA/HybF
MHELSIAQGIVDICTEHAGGRRVLAVTLEVGALSGVVPEALEFCFEACTRETLLEGARLEIERVGAVGHCPACGLDHDIRACFDPCPACDGLLEVRRGEELRVKELEVA